MADFSGPPGAFMVPTYPDPSKQNVNCLPMGFAYGEGNYLDDVTAPTVPTGLTSPSHTGNSISLAWTKSTDAFSVDHYNIYVGGTLAGSTPNLTATLSGLVGATLYNIKISAVDEHGNESAQTSNLAVTTA